MLWLLLFALKVPLGRKFFFDKRLSKDNSIACAALLANVPERR